MKRSSCRFVATLIGVVGAVAAWIPSCVAAEPSLVEELREIVRSQERAAKAEAEAARMSLMKEALKLAELDKVAARDELQKVTKARAELRHQISVQNWALGTFESSERGRTPPARISKYMAHLESSRAGFRRQFLTLPHESRGAISSGRALNFFLDACGSVALNHELLRKQLKDQLSDPDLPPEQRQDLLERQKLVAGIGGKDALTEEHRQRIRYEAGLTGSKLIIDARDGALPLNWPAVLTANAEFQPGMHLLTEAKEAALADLRMGKPISPSTQDTMLKAADELHWEFKRYSSRFTALPADSRAITQWANAKRFVAGLRGGVSRFVEARQITDVEPDEKFHGTRIEELLAFMARQGYRFAEADVNSERAYQALFTQMVEYYSNLYSLNLAVQSDMRNEQDLESRASKLFQTGYRNTMDDLKAAMESRPPIHWTEMVLNLGNGLADLGQGAKDIRQSVGGDDGFSRDEILKKLGQARELRQAGLSEEEIALRLGVTVAQYRRWQNLYDKN